MIPMTWDGLNRLHRIVGHLLAAASEIDELGPNILDWAKVSELLEQEQGVSLRKLRDCCDFLCSIEHSERERAKKWEEEHFSK